MATWNELKNSITFGGLVKDEWIPRSIHVYRYDKNPEFPEIVSYLNASEYMRKLIKEKRVKEKIPADYFGKAHLREIFAHYVRIGDMTWDEANEIFDERYENYYLLHYNPESEKEHWSFIFDEKTVEEQEREMAPLKAWMEDNGMMAALEAGVPLNDILA